MSRKLRSFKSDQTSSKSGDLLSSYDRLLTIYIDELRKAPVNPYQSLPKLATKLFWPPFLNRVIEMTQRLILVPNVLKIDFIGADSLLRELENLDNQTLRAVSECNQINRRRMLRRSVMGFAPQIATGCLAVLGIAKAIKESISWDVFNYFPEHLWIALAGATFFFLGIAAINFLLSIQSVRLLQAFDDLIAIAQAQRGIE